MSQQLNLFKNVKVVFFLSLFESSKLWRLSFANNFEKGILDMGNVKHVGTTYWTSREFLGVLRYLVMSYSGMLIRINKRADYYRIYFTDVDQFHNFLKLFSFFTNIPFIISRQCLFIVENLVVPLDTYSRFIQLKDKLVRLPLSQLKCQLFLLLNSQKLNLLKNFHFLKYSVYKRIFFCFKQKKIN